MSDALKCLDEETLKIESFVCLYEFVNRDHTHFATARLSLNF